MRASRVVLSSSARARPTPVWHVGRQGDVAGGMTQVVNGYLAWPFTRSRPAVIVSRDGSKGIGAVLLFMRAVLFLAGIRDASRSVVVVHLSQGGSFIREGFLLWLAKLRGSGTIAHLHGSRFVPFSQRRPKLVRAVLANARRIIVLSEATQQALTYLVDPQRICLLPNAVPGGVEQNKEPLVVFGGAVSKRKGVDVLMAAWRASCTGRGWRLVVAGPVIDEQVVDRSMPDADFVGALSHEALMSLLDRSAIAVLPSRDEAMPMFILEALARRNCVVSTPVGGIPAVLDGGCGVLSEPGDAVALATALNRLMLDAPLRQDIARRGHRRFDTSFSAQAIYPRVEQLWLSSLDRGG